MGVLGLYGNIAALVFIGAAVFLAYKILKSVEDEGRENEN